MTEASFLSLSTRAVTSSTTIPAARVGGSFISTTSMRGERSTPSEAASMASIFFFLAFMMLGSLAYRGSFRRRSAVTTSGVPTWITSVPLSVSRSAVTPPSANVSSEAMVACGQPSMAASMGPVCAQSPSIDCLPSRTTSGASFSTISFSSFATARERMEEEHGTNPAQRSFKGRTDGRANERTNGRTGERPRNGERRWVRSVEGSQRRVCAAFGGGCTRCARTPRLGAAVCSGCGRRGETRGEPRHTGKRLELLVQTHVGGHVDAAVSTHGESRPDLLLRVLRADRHGHDLRRGLSLLHADRLLHGDLAEGVHRHLHVRELDALFIGRDAHLDGIVDDPLDSDENLHLQRRWRRRRCVRRGLARRGGGVRWCQRHRPGRPADGRTLDGGAVMCH
mmetsp:Transcript_69668/g.194741  ORF Transcript_69668/g.194741 Transcript_69668/m.194741 type:complete len:395 (-) Transcript_69668:72-1256(-)